MPDSASQQPIRIFPPRIEARGEWVRATFPVEGLGRPELWFDVDAGFADFVHDSCDAALSALLLAAMAEGRPVRVEGTLSDRLLWNLRNTVIPVVLRQLPFLGTTRIDVEELTTPPESTGDVVLTGLSCGVDSFSAIQDHLLDPAVRAAQRVTHFLFSHVGHHGYGGDLDGRVARRWDGVRRAAGELGLPILRVYSNTPEFYPPEYDARFNWIATLTLRNSAVPLLLQQRVRRFLFASSHSWSQIGVRPSRDMTVADPILVPALGTERIELSVVGSEHSRVEKTRRIADLDIVQRHLDVCIMEGGTNCSKCEKCLRTMLTLELLERLPDFEGRFDLAAYGPLRRGFLARVLVASDGELFHREIRDLIGEVGFRSDMLTRLQAGAIRLWRLIPHDVRRRIRGHS